MGISVTSNVLKGFARQAHILLENLNGSKETTETKNRILKTSVQVPVDIRGSEVKSRKKTEDSIPKPSLFGTAAQDKCTSLDYE